MDIKESVISILASNKPDVLARIAGTFSGRGFNIDSITANITRDPRITKILITTHGDQDTIIKIEKQLNRLVDIHQVTDLTSLGLPLREMMLIRMPMTGENQDKIMEIVDRYRGEVIETGAGYGVLELAGNKEDMDNAFAALEQLGIDDFARTGSITL
ncbi:MAG: Acetolactate synthase isozyme 3 small subunit [Syntrophus sp. PtaU1.Bin005]|jgi:acetolactate synthase-1/3 small subunit|uniref:acetolactate synthase small subunit n=1 Tax=Syntrophus TaxID=43773 RepID=UPI0009C60845|nr:MAG: Acetolactate synthase isozyme 3 small subunit [Syntrophus sp. PtaB.Bin138]OPY80354.1 MAG: Acetolactate synthase isozyme 3 small subunit [Syntrophus sp. PtaU1.Bin005]